MSDNLTEKEAYEAMFDFLEQLYNRTQSEAVGGLLGDMSFLSDGSTADPAVWHEWSKCIAKAKSEKVDANLRLGNIDID